jgi:riboflavin kinase/FMN adenylyltransferase
MRLFRHHTEIPVEARNAVVALGNFDGVHRGHQAVIGAALARAREIGTTSAVLTFEPHPREFFKPDQPSFRLTPLRIKVRQLEAIGVDNLFVLPFGPRLAQMSAEAFVIEVLIEGLEAQLWWSAMTSCSGASVAATPRSWKISGGRMAWA